MVPFSACCVPRYLIEGKETDGEREGRTPDTNQKPKPYA